MGGSVKYVLWAVVFGVLFFILVKHMERHSIYFPMKAVKYTPDMISLSYEDITLQTADGVRLNGWFVPCDNAKFTVLFCHGNGGNISHRLEKLMIFHNLGLSVFIFDYRGYGKSQGSPSEQGLYQDVDAAYRYLTEKRRISGDAIVLFGESLGAAVVIDLAEREKARGLITEEA